MFSISAACAAGVILTHGNMVTAIRSILPLLDPSPDDVYIAYLPLAHVLEIIGKF
jgi:long-chain acyl-CoA synthetase